MVKHPLSLSFLFRCLIILAFLLPPAQSVNAQDQTPPPSPESDGIITIYKDETGLVRYMATETGEPLYTPSPAAGEIQSTAIAFDFLNTIGAGFGLSDPENELNLMDAQQDENGREFLRFQQVFQGVPVVGGELIIQLGADGSVLSASGEVAAGLEISTQPVLDGDTARQLALQTVLETYPDLNLTPEQIALSEPELWIYDSILVDTLHVRQQSLTWKIVATTDPLAQKGIVPLHHIIYINAHTAEIAFDFDNIQSLRRSIYDCADWQECYPVWWEGLAESNWYFGYWGMNENDPHAQDSKAVREYMTYFYDFYSSVHGRNSYNNQDAPLTALVALYDPGSFYNNAAWTGNYVIFAPGYVTKDVVVHELTHAVTQYTSRLIYYDQSGAINEAFSDLWGEFVDQYTDELGNRKYPSFGSSTEDSSDGAWPHREGYVFTASRYNPSLGFTPASGANRSLSNPALFGNTFREFTGGMPNTTQANGSGGLGNYYCGPFDNAGVHHNSGVGNRVGYLIAKGNGGSITGLGILKTAQLFYEVQTRLLTSAADYQDLYYALLQAAQNLKAKNLFTDSDIETVRQAGELVQMQIQPCVGKRGYVAPAATRIVSPVGTLTLNTETPAVVNLVWRQKADATAYQMEIKPSSGSIIKLWLEQDDPLANCVNGTCSYQMPLVYGLRYSWRIQTRNAVGEGPWTAYATFTLPYASGSVHTSLLAPANSLTPPVEAIRPQFQWQHHPANADYILKLYKIGLNSLGAETKTLFLSATYNAAKYCSTTTEQCQVNIAKSLTADTVYEWLVVGKRGSVIAPEADATRWRFKTIAKPGAIVLDSINATTATLTPQVSWVLTAGDTASAYNLVVSGPGGRFTQVVNRAASCSGVNCAVTLIRSIEGGANTFQVNSVNQFGTVVGPKKIIQFAPPDQKPSLTLITSTNNRPVFMWTPVERATSYLLSARSTVGSYSATILLTACTPSLCTFRSTTALKQGDWIWTIQPKNKGGVNLASLSDAGSFTTGVLHKAPLAPVLNMPLQNSLIPAALATGSTTTVLTWSPNAAGEQPTEFIVTLSKNGKPAMPAATVQYSAVCTGSAPPICQITTPALTTGKYTWNVTPLTQGVSGAKSTTRTFSISPASPQVISGRALSGSQNLYQLSTAWQPQTYVQQYRLLLLRINGAVTSTLYSKTFTTAAICPGGNCQWTLPPALSNGNYSARITPVSNGVAGLPLTMDFTVAAMTSEYFTTNLNNAITDKWVFDPGFNWSFASGAAVGTVINPDEEDVHYLSAEYIDPAPAKITGNIDITARMKMTGCVRVYDNECWYGITLTSAEGIVSIFLDQWGNYSVNVGSDQPLGMKIRKYTTANPKIARSNWNTLRVIIYNNNLLVYVNGVKIYADYIEELANSGQVTPAYVMATTLEGTDLGRDIKTSRLYLDYVQVYQANPFSILP